MRSFVLQDWVTLKGATATTSIVQPAGDYLDLEEFQDAVAWIDVREATLGGATTATLAIQSAPIKEEAFFVPTNVAARAVTLSAPTVQVISIVLNNSLFAGSSQLSLPIARWLRWNLSIAGGSTPWSVTFRVLVAAHSLSYTGS